MYTDFKTLSGFVQTALETRSDFELYHGVSTNRKSVRAQITLSLPDAPEVRISFGDREHGEKVSRAVLANNTKIQVRMEDVVRHMRTATVDSPWKRVITKETPLFNLNVAADGEVEIEGTIVGVSRNACFSPSETTRREFMVSVTNHALTSVTKELVELEPTIMKVMLPTNTKLGLDDAVKVKGVYRFPNLLSSAWVIQ